MSIDSEAASSIAGLTLSGRPLVVVDVDEVVVHMVKPFAVWLEGRDLWLDLTSYRLTGNIKYAGTERAVPKEDVNALIQAFFDERIHAQETVEHASAVLARLERTCEVVLLTNAPHRHRDVRRKSLADQGVTVPLITNDGPKGPAVAALQARAVAAGAPETLVFIDDSGPNLDSVASHVADARLVHFIAHDGLRAIARDIAGVSLKTGDWLAVERFVTETLR